MGLNFLEDDIIENKRDPETLVTRIENDLNLPDCLDEDDEVVTPEGYLAAKSFVDYYRAYKSRTSK